MRSPALLLLLLPLLAACPEPPDFYELNDLPVAQAVVRAPGVEEPAGRLGWVVGGDVAWLDGTLSHDPDGRPETEITFGWTFDAVPEGSLLTDADIVEADEWGYASFVPDELGEYRVQLIVTDRKDAVSRPDIAVVLATPPVELTAELSWETARVDLDLHLVHPDGAYFDAERDCFSWNPNPNWGDAASSVDDPRLDGDADGEGAGPYREQIELPLPSVGQYEVLVHYYLDHGAALGQDDLPAQPTVTLRAGDEVLYADLPAPQGLLQGDVWRVGLFDWPAGGFAVVNQVVAHADLAP